MAFNVMDTVSTNPADYSGLSGLKGLDLTGIGMGGPYVPPAAPAQEQPKTPQKTAQDLYWEQQAEYARQAREAQINSIAQSVKGLFDQYGLGSLYPKILEYAQQGLNGDAIAIMLRQTQEYKNRFPAMEALAKKGRAMSEAAYVDYERTAAALEQRYGFAKGLISDAVTDLLVGDVSASELNDRARLAAADAITAPDDLKQQIRDYYGIDPDTALRSYYLDPQRAMPILEKQSQSARIGAWATRNGVDQFGVSEAERLQGLGVSEDQAQQGFGRVAAQRGLTYGKGDSVTQGQLIEGNLVGQAEALQAMQRTASSRVGRFAGGGGYTGGKEGNSGLTSSSI